MARTPSTADERSHRMGMLALFCDMGDQWREEFRMWLSEDMFPARMGIGFPACASYDALPGLEGAGSEGSQTVAPPAAAVSRP